MTEQIGVALRYISVEFCQEGDEDVFTFRGRERVNECKKVGYKEIRHLAPVLRGLDTQL